MRRLFGVLAIATALGCSGPAPNKTNAPAASASATAAAGPKSTAPSAPQAELGSAPAPSASAPRRQFREEDFSETENSRDPFRSFAAVFADLGRARIHSERQVLLGRYSVDELKLIALVTRTDEPRAMLVDPSGRGWVVTRGQFIGRPDIVHAGGPGGMDYEVNWRVDRIREGDVVLVREDPTHPDVAPATRVIALRANAGEASDEVVRH